MKLLIACVFLLSESLLAGNLERFLFDSQGAPLEISGESISSEANLQMARVPYSCVSNPELKCISFDLLVSQANLMTSLRSHLLNVIGMWNSWTGSKVVLSFGQWRSDTRLTYKQNTGGEIIRDQWNRPIPEGNFVVSFNPPEDVQFSQGQVSMTKHYVVAGDDRFAEIRWAGIFFNPSLRPDQDYDVESALAFEIGRALGLAPSGLRASALFPYDPENGLKRVVSLDDFNWLTEIYGAGPEVTNLSKLTGKVINGSNGEGLAGIHIQVLPYNQAENFSKSLDRSLFVASGFSESDGSFSIPVVAGDYILLFEAIEALPFVSSRLSAWIQKIQSHHHFEAEFYDGKERESNHEAILTFSPQAVLYAAKVRAKAGQVTSDIELITNEGDPKLTRRGAKGSSDEELSASVPPQSITDSHSSESSKSSVESSNNSQSSNDARGGCQLQVRGNAKNFFNLFGLFFALCLALRVRWVLRVK